MAVARRRGWIVLLLVGLVAAATYATAPPAHAATCVNVPGSTPGLNLSVGGQPRRVPGVSEVSVCADTGYVPLVSVTLDGRGHCTWGCFSVVAQGGSVKPPALTVNYKLDGVLSSTTVGGGTGGPGTETCLLSVGGRYAPYPTCEGFGLGIDQDDPTQGVLELVQQQVENVEATVNDAIADLNGTIAAVQEDVLATVDDLGETVEDVQEDVDDVVQNTIMPFVDSLDDTVCATVPPMYDQEQEWERVDFCDDPLRWALAVPDAPCDYVPWYWDDENYEYVSPCNNAARWAQLVVEELVQTECQVDRLCILNHSVIEHFVRQVCGALPDPVQEPCNDLTNL